MKALRRAVYISLAAAALGLSACGGNNDGDVTPPQQCRQFGHVWCTQAMSCLVSIGTLPPADEAENRSVCIDVAHAAARCDRAIAVGASYDECLADIESMECSEWDVPVEDLGSVAPPSTCEQVIIVQ